MMWDVIVFLKRPSLQGNSAPLKQQQSEFPLFQDKSFIETSKVQKNTLIAVLCTLIYDNTDLDLDS